MQFKGRSLYNLLRISLKEDPKLKVDPWQVENYRDLAVEDLLNRLQKLGISLTEESFLLYVENCDTPEELLECLWVNESDLVGQEKTYLLLFELWRRWVPEKQSLSIFCDQLDDLIFRYDEGVLEDEELLQIALSELEDVLDESVDQGSRPQEIFQTVTRYMAHDLEEFLYDYLIDLIDQSNELYASELIDGMGAYVTERKWFDLVKARLFFLSNSPETPIFISRVIEQAEEDPDLTFLLELGQFVIQLEEVDLFRQCIKQMINLVKTQEDLIEVLDLMREFFEYRDLGSVAESVKRYLENRFKSLDVASEEDRKVIGKFLSEV